MKKYLIALALVGLTTTSCYEKLTIAPPNAIIDEDVQRLLKTGDDATVAAILGGIADGLPPQFKMGGYSTFNNNYEYNYQGQDALRSIGGNDIVTSSTSFTSPSGDQSNFYTCTNLTSSPSNSNVPWWNRGYGMITNANKVMNSITDDMVATSTSKKLKEYQARGLMVRAYAYNYLMENYQDAYTNGGSGKLGVPIYTKYNINQEPVARATATVTYDSILIWAQKAVNQLKDAGVGYTKDNTEDLDLGVANFILARAALCAGQWQTVITACDEILAAYPDLMKQKQYVGRNVAPAGASYVAYLAENNGFLCLAQNPEAIFGWSYSTKSYSSMQAWMNNLIAPSVSSIDSRLYDKIATGDYRKDNFLPGRWGKYNVPNTKINDGIEYNMGTYLNVKFACNVGIGRTIENANATTASQTDYIYFRASEAILMKAEAQFRAGQEATALATLDKLVSTRTNGTYTASTYPTSTSMSTLEKIQLQTRIEMWGERGLEWYNNRRWNIPVNRSGSVNHWNPAFTYPVSGMTLQIPMQEISTNNLIQQN